MGGAVARRRRRIWSGWVVVAVIKPCRKQFLTHMKNCSLCCNKRLVFVLYVEALSTTRIERHILQVLFPFLILFFTCPGGFVFGCAGELLRVCVCERERQIGW